MAKILGEKIPFLVMRPLANGQQGYYWVPGATLKRAGWKGLSLGTDLVAAINTAKKQNDRVTEWRSGGAKPKKIERYVAPATVADLLRRFRTEHLAKVAPSTARTYAAALKKIERWTNDGQWPMAYIDRDRVKAFRDGLMMPDPKTGEPRHHTAHGTLRVARTLFQFAVDEMGLPANPFVNFGLATPDPRSNLWEEDSEQFFLQVARDMGRHDVAFAFEIAFYIGQRQADVLKINGSHWQPVRLEDDRMIDALADSDGTVMGIALRQNKTNEFVGIPFDRQMRRRVEQAFAVNKTKMENDNPGAQVINAAVPLLVNQETGHAWVQHVFQRRFNAIKQEAIQRAKAANNHYLAEALTHLMYRDTRRTCAVRLSRLGMNDQQLSAITGHKLETIKKILEVYAPRDNTMAAGAVIARLDHAAATKTHREKKEAKA